MRIKVLSFDVGKKCTGWSVYNGKFDKKEMGEFKFESLMQYREKVEHIIVKYDPDVVTYSRTIVMNRKAMHDLCFLMAMVEEACERINTLCYPTNDATCRAFIKSKGKSDTLAWAKKQLKDTKFLRGKQDVADSMIFGLKVYDQFKKENS